MINGAYTLANSTMPTEGGRLVTVTHTANTGNDTLGTIAVVGTDLSGASVSDTITPTAGGTATGTTVFKTLTSVTGSGWAINGGNDTITVGCSATPFAADKPGLLGTVIVNTTAAGTVTIADQAGTIAILKASIAEGFYRFDMRYAGYLTVALGAASDVTVTTSQFG
jgi:hypothetical protein